MSSTPAAWASGGPISMARSDATPRPAPGSFRRRGGAIWPRSPTPCATITRPSPSRAASPASASICARPSGCWARPAPRSRRRSPICSRSRDKALDPRCRRLIEIWPTVRETYAPRRVRRAHARPRDPHPAPPHDAGRQPHAEGRVAVLRGRGRDPQVAAEGERSRQLPIHRRRLLLQARGRGSDPDVRRRGRSVPDQRAASSCCRRTPRPSGCRPPSTRSPSTASTPTTGPTSTARSATPASRSRPSTTSRRSMTVSPCAIR